MHKDKIRNKIDSFGIMNSIWMKKQVEGHLFFGLMCKHIPCLALGGFFLGLFYVWNVYSNEKISSSRIIANLIEGGIVTAALIYASFCLSKYQQAVISWMSMKIGLGIAAFILMTVGTAVSLNKHQPEALPNFLLGLVWLPWIEFVAVVVPYQKLVTLARLLLTIPIVYLGIQSGYWSWN